MTVTGMLLSDLNMLLLLNYPFMSNPRYCLGCATQKNEKMIYIPSFFYNWCFCVPYTTLFANFASTSRKDPTFTLQYKKCIPHVPRRKYYSNEVSRVQNDFTIHSSKMEGLTSKLLQSEKAIFVTQVTIYRESCLFYHT